MRILVHISISTGFFSIKAGSVYEIAGESDYFYSLIIDEQQCHIPKNCASTIITPWEALQYLYDGKCVEEWDGSYDTWLLINKDTLIGLDYYYRLKPVDDANALVVNVQTSKYSPFTSDDWKIFTQYPVRRMLNKSQSQIITTYDSNGVICLGQYFDYQKALESIEFVNGALFGKLNGIP